MRFNRIVVAVASSFMLMSASAAHAGCVTKHAVATSGTESSAKWFALETMVQSVSWALWPGFVATGDVAGYKIAKQKYKCKTAGGGVTCRGSAKFCEK